MFYDKRRTFELSFKRNVITTNCIRKGIGYKTVLYWIKQYSLQTNFPKLPPLHLDKIETKEWAYFIGFVCGDGSITETEVVELTLALKDKEILDFLSNIFSVVVKYE